MKPAGKTKTAPAKKRVGKPLARAVAPGNRVPAKKVTAKTAPAKKVAVKGIRKTAAKKSAPDKKSAAKQAPAKASLPLARPSASVVSEANIKA